MFDEVTLAKLETCLEHILQIEFYNATILIPEDYLNVNNEVFYDATLMRLQALGEGFKSLSRKYPEVITALNYKEIDDLIKFRDFISHHYEKLEYEILYDTCKNDIPALKKCLITLIESLKDK